MYVLTRAVLRLVRPFDGIVCRNRRVCVRVRVRVRVRVCVSFRRYTRRRLWSDRDQILHTHADSSPNGSELNKNQPCVTQGGFGGF